MIHSGEFRHYLFPLPCLTLSSFFFRFLLLLHLHVNFSAKLQCLQSLTRGPTAASATLLVFFPPAPPYVTLSSSFLFLVLNLRLYIIALALGFNRLTSSVWWWCRYSRTAMLLQSSSLFYLQDNLWILYVWEWRQVFASYRSQYVCYNEMQNALFGRKKSHVKTSVVRAGSML